MLDLPAPYDLIFENDSRCRLFEMLNWNVVLQTLVTKVFHVSQRQKCPTNVVGCFPKSAAKFIVERGLCVDMIFTFYRLIIQRINFFHMVSPPNGIQPL